MKNSLLVFFSYIPGVLPALRLMFFWLNSVSYRGIVTVSTFLEGGLHPKHRLTRYHDFFVEHVQPGQRILDVGCGNGQVILKIASQKKCRVVGVDIEEVNIVIARKCLKNVREVELVSSDIRDYSGNGRFDVIIMSNVLEHLAGRVELLKSLVSKFNPDCFLVRVPMFERDWTVPYKKELGLNWKLDSTHETEYTETELRAELESAGLQVETILFRWSEMYLKAVPKNG